MRFTASDFMTSCGHDNHKKKPPSVKVNLREHCSAFIIIYDVSLLLFRNKPYLMILMQNIGCFTTSFNQLFLTMWPEQNKSVFQEWGEREKAQHKHKNISWRASHIQERKITQQMLQQKPQISALNALPLYHHYSPSSQYCTCQISLCKWALWWLADILIQAQISMKLWTSSARWTDLNHWAQTSHRFFIYA